MKLVQLVPEDLFKHQIQVIELDLPLIVENTKGSRIRLEGDRVKQFFSRPEVFDKYSYFIHQEDLNKWRQICANRINHPNHKGDVPNIDGARLIGEFRRLSELSLADRINLLSTDHRRLNATLTEKRGRIDGETAEIVFPITKTATLMAGVAMSDHNRTNEKEQPGLVIRESSQTILSIADAIGKNPNSIKSFKSVKEFRQSDTVAHCGRVFHMYSDLLYYYHNIVGDEDTRKELIESIEAQCESYYRFYHSFQPHKRMKKVDDIFEGSLPFLSKAEITTLSLAAAYHDLGKIVRLDYYESDFTRDDSIIEQHPNEVFEMLNIFPIGSNVAQTASMHHEMYGGGYGPYASLGGAYYATHPHKNIDYVVTNDIDPILKEQKDYIPGYFPAKFLEICDVYDALHNKRGYKTAKPVSAVLTIMGEDFFNPDRLKTTVEELEDLCFGKKYWSRYFIKDLDSSLYGIRPYAKHTVAHDLEKLFPRVKPYIKSGRKLLTLPKEVKATILAYQALLRLQNKIIKNPGMLDPILFDIFIDYISQVENKDYSPYKYAAS